MTAPIVTPEVLRDMVRERLAASVRGEISADYLRGYLTAMFHAGALTVGESLELIGRSPSEGSAAGAIGPDALPTGTDEGD